MSRTKLRIVALLFIVYGMSLNKIEGLKIRMQRLECEVYEKSFGVIKECRLHQLGDTQKMNIHFQTDRLNVNNITVQATLYRKERKYKLFLYNDTIDFCHFVDTAKRHILWSYLYNEMKKYSNVNHSCPFKHDLILKNFGVGNTALKLIPIPRGQYMVTIKVGTFGIHRGHIMIYGDIK